MGRKSQETEAPRQLEPQAILPRPLIDQVEEKAAEQLEALYARISSEEALRAEEEQRSRLHPLEIAVLNVQFVLQEVSPIVIEPLRRRKKTEVVLSKGRLMLPEVDGVDYDITSYPNYDSPKRGCVSLAGNILGSGGEIPSIASRMQSRWDSDNASRRGIYKFSQYKKADLVNLFRGARPA